jgi:hypothetical protein
MTKIGGNGMQTAFPRHFPQVRRSSDAVLDAENRLAGTDHKPGFFGSVDWQVANSDLAGSGRCIWMAPISRCRPLTAKITKSPLAALKSA